MTKRADDNHSHSKSGKNHNDHHHKDQDREINAGGSNDWIWTGSGNDRINGGGGNDFIRAGKGNDVVNGGDGNDFIRGGEGNDILNGGRGSDHVRGGRGDDTLIFNESERGGSDRYVGGKGNDKLVLEFTASRWADAAVKAEVSAYLAHLASGSKADFTFKTMNLVVSSVEALVVKVNGVVVDPTGGVTPPPAPTNIVPTGVADSYAVGENATLNVSTASGLGTLVGNDQTGTGAFAVELVTGPANGSLVLNANGTFVFTPGSAFDHLSSGQTALETFTYRIVNSAGTSAPITVSLNVAGANDGAAISGDLAATVLEDAATATGQVTVADVDSGQAAVGNAGTQQGTYGTFVLQADGTWTYTLDNSLDAVQALGEGDTLVETFAVTSLDGSASTPLSVTIRGANDGATISGDLGARVAEDATTASGRIAVADLDSGEAAIGNAGTQQGMYGTLVLQADGTWVYTLDNSLADVKSLGAGDTLAESFVVTSLDGTASTPLSVTITGTNDTATITGGISGVVVEDRADVATATGQVFVADMDGGEAAIGNAGTQQGKYGAFVLQADGTWSYTLDNSLATVQALGEGDVVVDTFTVTSFDGSAAEVVSITVQGTNEAAVISGDLAGSVVEDAIDPLTEAPVATTTGRIIVANVDEGQPAIGNPGTYQGTYGALVLQADGNWVYTLDNTLAAVQALGEGDTVVESFAVTTADGLDTSAIEITVTGSNDTPGFDGKFFGSVNEDGSTPVNETGTQVTNGDIIVFDDDAGEAGFINPGTVVSQYGTTEFTPEGGWTYTLNNDSAQVQALRGGEQVTDVIELTAIDGTTFTISVDIEGHNDASEISGTLNDTIVLGLGETNADGFITVTDIDQGESGVTAGSYSGTYGNLTLNEDGSWNYEFQAFDLVTNELQSFSDSFDLQTLGGDYFNISVEVMDGQLLFG